MKIAFFTEMGIQGKVPRDYNNNRVPTSWLTGLDADNHNLFTVNTAKLDKYDLGIVILPKKGIDKLMHQDVIGTLKKICTKVTIMQEGPNWYWQDYSMEEQIWYYNTLTDADFLLCHNESDVGYYKGLSNLNTYVMPSLMIEDTVKEVDDIPWPNKRENVMIGGNMTSWYGGFDSMIVANEFGSKIYAPSMGRKIAREDELDIEHLPYMTWTEWVMKLSNMRYGVHLMRTHAAGTFALNCAYLGIPCIGYRGLDTQENCHPSTTVEVGDLHTAKQIAKRLKEDKEFYEFCSQECKLNYNKYNEQNFVKHMNNIFIKEGII